MKVHSIAMAGIAAWALSVPAAAGNATGLYFGFGAGWALMPGFTQIETPTATGAGAPADYETETGSSVTLNGSVGYRFDNRLRLENEFGTSMHDVDGGDLAFGGRVNVRSDFLNLSYDLPLAPRWDVTFGGGVGVANVGIKIDYLGTTYFNKASYRPAAQGIVGLTYSLLDQFDVGVGYRYRAFIGETSVITPGGYCNDKVGNLTEHVVMLNLRFYVDSPSTPPPASFTPQPPPPSAAPPVPPAPMSPPPVTNYVVFFDFNKADLTVTSLQTITEAVKAAKANGFVKIQIVGHTDTVGSDPYNMKLSMARARVVKDEMVREGLDGSTIAVAGKGFHSPFVATGSGVREPQNRRAVIDLGK
jgi:OmpA-OmpF porin, OOP family